MPEPRGLPRTPKRDAWTCAAIIATLSVPAIATLRTIRIPQQFVPLKPDPSPRSYTVSLSLFLVPIAVIAVWFLRHPDHHFERRAFWRTIGLLVPLGFALDIFFGTTFFTFPNDRATLGIMIPVVGGAVPIEEFLFYASGFLAVLLGYIWGNLYWLAAYKVPDYRIESRALDRIVQFHSPTLLVGVLLIAAGIIYKRFFSPTPGLLPGYYLFLVVLALTPSLLLFASARPFINWRALSFSFFVLLLVSLLWEATLASPYRWWGYRDEQMLGLYIYAWCRLPIEAVIVWFAVTYMTVIVYEVVKIFLAVERPSREALFGLGVR
ncbi:MAG: hypothetical protein IRY99_19015 [Isosphaeraceae bacterium]|nr:hypothetical protein [Isosphaeraceae bacterium]